MTIITSNSFKSLSSKDLISIVIKCLSWIQDHHPSVDFTDLLSQIDLKFVLNVHDKLVNNSSSPESKVGNISESNMHKIESACQAGIWSADVIALESHVSLEVVHRLIGTLPGYGGLQYGTTKYGRCKSTSERGIPVRRRVSRNGQMSYRGIVYSLGKTYRGRIASVEEKGARLVLSFSHLKTITITNRSALP